MKTKTLRRSLLMFAAAMLFAMPIGPVLLAQDATSGPAAGSRNYNTATETTVSGTVEAVHDVTGRRGWNGMHVQLKTDQGDFDVHVGPSWFLAQKKFQIAKGDQIEVTGSKVRFNNADALIARTIKKGDSALTLRNAQGLPVWSRRGGGA